MEGIVERLVEAVALKHVKIRVLEILKNISKKFPFDLYLFRKNLEVMIKLKKLAQHSLDFSWSDFYEIYTDRNGIFGDNFWFHK